MENDSKKELVYAIIDVEWALFDKVQNKGGRAFCQDNWTTFKIMRSSQLLSWTPDMLESYKEDLSVAVKEHRNPLTEKYGYMMERTRPEEYAEIKDRLPACSEEKLTLADRICSYQVPWQDEIADRFPKLANRGRAIHSYEDAPRVTSFETYLWGELKTYSEHTLRLYAAYVEALKAENKNLNQLILENTVHQYGYTSLEEAESHLK